VKSPHTGSLRGDSANRATARTYLLLATAEFRRYSTYRLAIFAGVVTQSVFGFIRISVLFAAISAAGGTLAGYDELSASTYVWLGQALLAPIAIFGWIEIAERVSSGEIAVDFARPVDLQLAWWARDLGRACFQLLSRGLPPLLIGAVTVGFALPQSWTAYPLGLVSLLLAVSISFMVRFLVNLIAFWTFDVRGFVGLYVVLVGPLCGLFVPVHLFPEWLRILAYATPFPSMLQSPIDVLSGYALDMAAVAVVGTQLAWLVSSRVRSQLAYRTSFWLNVVTSVAVGLVEFIELYVILANVPVFGGLNLSQAALVFALANAGFALADFVFGQLDTMPTYLRLGRLEVMLVRPMPLLLQLITSDFQLRRLGRVAISVVIIFVVLPVLRLEYSPSTIYLLVITPFVGAAIYAAFFATAGGLQFFLINGAEFTSAFVYGGSYAGQLPGSVLIPPIRVLFTFVFPATVTAYLPALLIMGLEGPAYLPAWLGWFAPLFAAWAWLLAWLAWRAGMRRFTGAGG
jgi:ABC-2 type transport system permease protein